MSQSIRCRCGAILSAPEIAAYHNRCEDCYAEDLASLTQQTTPNPRQETGRPVCFFVTDRGRPAREERGLLL